MKILRKYIWLILIPLLLVGCAKGPGRVRLKPSNIRVSAEETEVNVACITGGFVVDIFTCGNDFQNQDQRGSDPTYRIIRTDDTIRGGEIPLEVENEWIHITMHSYHELTVRIKENNTGENRYGKVVFNSLGEDTGGFLKITQTAK